MSDYVTEDSGARRTFPGGGQRDTREGKGRYDLLSPVFMARLAAVAERGAAKYGERNWEKGLPLAQYLDSAFRHLFQYLDGKWEREDHLAQAAWNIMALIHTQELVDTDQLPDSLDDITISRVESPAIRRDWWVGMKKGVIPELDLPPLARRVPETLPDAHPTICGED